jgi:hypothetical protein
MEYCTTDSTVDKEEWNSVVKCMSRSMKRSEYLPGYFGEGYYRPVITDAELNNLVVVDNVVRFVLI